MEKRELSIYMGNDIDRLLSGQREALENVSSARWPIPFSIVDPLYLDIYSREYLADVTQICDKFSPQLAALLTGNANALREMAFHGWQGIEQFSQKPSESADYVSFVMKLMPYLKIDDFWHDNASNRICKWVDYLPNNKLNVGKVLRLSAVLGSYSEALYSHWRCFHLMQHGPYISKDKNLQVVVKDWYNLAPETLWPQSQRLPCTSLRIVLFYDTNATVYIDAFNHLLTPNNDIPLSTKVYVNNLTECNIDFIDNLHECVVNTCFTICSEVESYSEEQKCRVYIEEAYYGLRPLRNFLCKDWRPPKSVCERIGRNDW